MLHTENGKTAAEYIRLLPADQLNHMLQVGRLVHRFKNWLHGYEPLGADGTELAFFGLAAFYHDIGKIYIPPDILSKPGKLTEQEYKIVQRHPLHGRAFFCQAREGSVAGIPEHLLLLASNAAASHHEWWNGKGYPFGLAYREIPLIARVTAVCDAYDAMVSQRVYRQAYSSEEACAELQKNKGTQFEPGLVEIFLAHRKKLNQIYQMSMINAGVPHSHQEVFRFLE